MKSHIDAVLDCLDDALDELEGDGRARDAIKEAARILCTAHSTASAAMAKLPGRTHLAHPCQRCQTGDHRSGRHKTAVPLSAECPCPCNRTRATT